MKHFLLNFFIISTALKVVDSNTDSSVRYALLHNIMVPGNLVGNVAVRSLSQCALACQESQEDANVFQYLDLGNGTKVCRIFSQWAVYFSIRPNQQGEEVSYHAVVIANTTGKLILSKMLLNVK